MDNSVHQENIMNANNGEAYFGQILSDIGSQAEDLDEYTQGRLLVALGRSCLDSIGWIRSFKEKVLYGSYQNAMGVQNFARDDYGFFIGTEEGEKPTDPDGHIASGSDCYRRLSKAQRELIDTNDAKENALWALFDLIEQSWELVSGDRGGKMITFNAESRKKGISSLEDMIESSKRKAIQWYLDREEKDAKTKNKLKDAGIDFNLEQMKKRLATRSARR
jgi:hypothetical protein